MSCFQNNPGRSESAHRLGCYNQVALQGTLNRQFDAAAVAWTRDRLEGAIKTDDDFPGYRFAAQLVVSDKYLSVGDVAFYGDQCGYIDACFEIDQTFYVAVSRARETRPRLASGALCVQNYAPGEREVWPAEHARVALAWHVGDAETIVLLR